MTTKSDQRYRFCVFELYGVVWLIDLNTSSHDSGNIRAEEIEAIYVVDGSGQIPPQHHQPVPVLIPDNVTLVEIGNIPPRMPPCVAWDTARNTVRDSHPI